MSYFFSEKMTYCQALVSTQIAWDVFNQLGQQQKVALESKIINYENPFTKSLRRCDETLAKITVIKNNLQLYKKWLDFTIKESKDEKGIWDEFKSRIEQSRMEGYLYMNHIEDEVVHSYQYLSNQLREMQNLNKRVSELVYQMGLLVTLTAESTLSIFYGSNRDNDMQGLIADKNSIFQYKCICISRKELMMLKRGLFRITRGNSWVYQFQINTQELSRYFSIAKHREHAQQLMKNKLACFIMYQKGQRNYLLSKINKFIGCFDAHVLVAQMKNTREELPRLERKINELEAMEELTLQSIKKHIDRLCQVREGSTISWISYIQAYAKKQRQLYRALSTTQVSKNLIRFHLYIPTKDLPLTIQPKISVPPLILNVLQTKKMPPSKFDSNVMLQIPQAIVNTYGVPSYYEINPAPFYIVTFGFFIGVMFGDVGHMLMAIPLLIHFKANLWFWTVIFFMGYCGLIYNEFFGLNFGIFSSCYTILDDGSTATAFRQKECVYPLGIDSIWKVSQNEMSFTNSLKMKAAVILGVVHMMFGLFLRLWNNIRQKQILDIITLTIPQIIFMVCTFVYMDYLIIFKWNHTYDNPTTAPSIISTMISVYVNMASDNPKDILFWANERSSERVIVVIALLCVPVMLVGKTIVIYCMRRKASKGQSQINELIEDNEQIQMQEIQHDKFSNEEMKKQIISSKHKQSQQQEPLSQIAVHQFIETIEFVLGSVSNTASYLRLWALSLAHAQLSAVIFQLTVLRMLQGGYSKLFGLFMVFPFFFLINFGVLICMDSLECFLHSLRLHWVQFQNKFYQGKGYLFEPFTFAIK